MVVLIDDYDAPVSEIPANLANPAVASESSRILKGFYSAFKDAGTFLRFVFVTGVTRYAFMGLPAGLNTNLMI